LIFDRDVFQFPAFHEEVGFARRRELIECTIKKCGEKRNSHLTAKLIIKKEQNQDFVGTFNFRSKTVNDQKAPSPSYLALKARARLYAFSDEWIKVYHKRLGIKFDSAKKKWIEKTLENGPIKERGIVNLTERMSLCFLAYIHLVDLIITVLPAPSGLMMVDRMKVFRTAVSCFQSYTEKTIRENQLNITEIKKDFIIWNYISFWIHKNEEYKSIEIINHWQTWKSVFNFIFGNSIDRFNQQISSGEN
jgi:hypothetical protein